LTRRYARPLADSLGRNAVVNQMIATIEIGPEPDLNPAHPPSMVMFPEIGPVLAAVAVFLPVVSVLGIPIVFLFRPELGSGAVTIAGALLLLLIFSLPPVMFESSRAKGRVKRWRSAVSKRWAITHQAAATYLSGLPELPRSKDYEELVANAEGLLLFSDTHVAQVSWDAIEGARPYALESQEAHWDAAWEMYETVTHGSPQLAIRMGGREDPLVMTLADNGAVHRWIDIVASGRPHNE
jgi:hypothetical protein